MPRKYVPRRRKKRTTRRRKSYRSLVSSAVPSGMPTIRIAKLRYVERLTLTSTLGGLGEYTYRANSIFDPNASGIGHQPMGRDTWATLYDHYVVLSSKVNCKVSQEEETTSPKARVMSAGVYLGDNSTTPYTDFTEFMEANRGSQRLLCARQARPATLRASFSAKKFFNLHDVKDNKNIVGAKQGFDPTEGSYYHFWCQTHDQETSSVTFIITIDYLVQFSEPKDLAQS